MLNTNFFYNRAAHESEAMALDILTRYVGDGITVSRWVSNISKAKQKVIYIVHRGTRNQFASKQENSLFQVEAVARGGVRDEMGLMQQVATFLLNHITAEQGEKAHTEAEHQYNLMRFGGID